MTPATIADHARELFKKNTGYANKTMKKLEMDMVEAALNAEY